MTGFTSIDDARTAMNLDDEKQELLEQVRALASVTDDELCAGTDGERYLQINFSIHNAELRVLIERELRDRIVEIDVGLRELGIDPDAETKELDPYWVSDAAALSR